VVAINKEGMNFLSDHVNRKAICERSLWSSKWKSVSARWPPTWPKIEKTKHAKIHWKMHKKLKESFTKH